jgi:V/A-type H+-transporting ATPase subunit D
VSDYSENGSANIAHNKSSLNATKRRKEILLRYLPSLELKQQQLLRERFKNQQEQKTLKAKINTLYTIVEQQFPMLADANIDLNGLITIKELKVKQVNVVGTVLPEIETLSVQCKPYSYLARPHWVDHLVTLWEDLLKLKIRLKINEDRQQKLQLAVQKVTQRVNLFSKVLLPQADATIKQITIFLSDQERAAVVRAKLAKQRQAVL